MTTKRRILYLSEMRPATGGGWAGGYSAITEGLCTALHKEGHEVKVLGISYMGDRPHDMPFSIIPVVDNNFLEVQIRDILEGWAPDDMVVALDLPMHADIFPRVQSKVRYIAVYPVEGAPVLPSWSDMAAQFDANFTLSEFGVAAMHKAGIEAKIIHVGVTHGTGVADIAEVLKVRETSPLGNRFVVLKVADNHGRKNWAHTVEFFAKWGPADSVLYAVTRPDNDWGWALEPLIEEFGGVRDPNRMIWKWPNGKELWILTNLSRKEVSVIYNLAATRGCLLMDTGNEGLGMPILEAMYTGLPVVGMDHTAIHELLSNGRGYLFKPDYEYRDTFGNVRRFYPGYDEWSTALQHVYDHFDEAREVARTANQWVQTRLWRDAALALLTEA